MVTKEELGRRLRVSRENAGLTQEAVARELEITRGALAQIEGGLRAPNSLHLARLAEIYGREISDFLKAGIDAPQQDALAVLFRAEAGLAGDVERVEAIRRGARLSREYTSLESLLDLDDDRVYPVRYGVPQPRTKWEAIRQGERLAELERSRLGLDNNPIRDVAEILEPQGIRVLELALPENISGVFLNDQRYGLSILVNSANAGRRQRFSYAHEYCHVLTDTDRTSLVSKAENRQELVEVRANAFAAAFLMPAEGARDWLLPMGKGEPSRSTLQAFDDSDVVTGQKRVEARSQDLQVYDVVHIAHHFGVSYEMALYRLLNLKLLSEEELKHLRAQCGRANAIRRLLGPEPQETGRRQADLGHRFLFLALEAFRRGVISRGKLRELHALVSNAETPELEDLLATVEEEGDSGHDAIYIPRE